MFRFLRPKPVSRDRKASNRYAGAGRHRRGSAMAAPTGARSQIRGRGHVSGTITSFNAKTVKNLFRGW